MSTHTGGCGHGVWKVWSLSVVGVAMEYKVGVVINHGIKWAWS